MPPLLGLGRAGICQESGVQDDKNQVDESPAEKDRVKAAEGYVVNEDHSERRFPIDAQPDDTQIGVQVSVDVVVPYTEDKGQGQPGLKKAR